MKPEYKHNVQVHIKWFPIENRYKENTEVLSGLRSYSGLICVVYVNYASLIWWLLNLIF